MLAINKVMITGRLVRDPETRFTASGQAVTNFSVAVNRRFLDSKTNEWRDETVFLDVESWGKLAERCSETLKKGRPVYVEGRLRADTWENREGQKQTRIKVVAERVSAFDVPARGEVASDDLAADVEPNSLQPGTETSPSPARHSSSPVGRAPTGTSRPASATDGLAFDSPDDKEPNVEDDIPF